VRPSLLLCVVLVWLPAWVRAAPCRVVTLPHEPVLAALQRAGQAPAAVRPPPAPSRWWVLAPTNVSLTARDGVRQSLGYVDLASGMVSERTAMLADTGLAIRLDWDLRPLWQPRPTAPLVSAEARLDQRLAAHLRLEQLAQRTADHWLALRKAGALARGLQEGEPLCWEAQAEAEAAALALLALQSAVGR
jgi:hypothetical protein